tara:strand:+ start:1505 stop:1864 length:360 start_codon:yes stop_codon:yes gene_type:complete
MLNKTEKPRLFALCMVTAIGYGMTALQAAEKTEAQKQKEAMAEMQRRLNAEVMERPFSVEAEEKIDAYIKNAMAKDLKPEVRKAPDFWRPGYTCRDIYHHGWNYYRNCRYYRSYYGRYW